MARGAGGRPRAVIDWELVDNLCEIQCTAEEIAQVLKIDADTLATACKREHKLSFSDYFELKRGTGKASLRRAQWMAAQTGNPTMLIWLGKQYLSQLDKQQTQISGVGGGPIEISNLTADQKRARLEELLAKRGKTE